MRIEAPYYPIIYVRGFAAGMKEIEDTTATPYMGFKAGDTHPPRPGFRGRLILKISPWNQE